MNRRAFLRAIGSAALVSIVPRRLFAGAGLTRYRPSDTAWPSDSEWKRLNEAVGGNLVRVEFPLDALKTDPDGAAAKELLRNIKNPYFIGDQPGLTETLGWLDAWATKPSAYAVAARSARDIAQAVNFAREHNLRLVVKGGGHSYQGTSNAPDSLLIWTRRMHEIRMHDAFVPHGCERTVKPQPAVTMGAGTIGMQAYRAVTTEGGKYVQGGGCLTVGLAGLLQGGGFGSFSKHYGTAAASLLEAEVVTADGRIRIANPCSEPDLFWALKGGGGGTFGVISRMTLKLHELPDYFCLVSFKIKAPSDEAYRRLVRRFVDFYREQLFNHHWGEQAHIRPDNTLEIMMLGHGIDSVEAGRIWRPFIDWAKSSGDGYSVKWPVTIGAVPARHFWDVDWYKAHWADAVFPNPAGNPLRALMDYGLNHLVGQPIVELDRRPGAPPGDAWWKGNTGECGWFIWAYQSIWMPESLLADDSRQHLADALFAGSRHSAIELHFNKGLAGAPEEVIAAARDTATNPAVLNAFALAIVANGQGPAYPGVHGHEPSVSEGRASAVRIDRCMDELRRVAPNGGAYVSESNYFEKGFQQSYWGSNYPRLAAVKQRYDPGGLFFVHNGVGSEQWSVDGFTRLS